MSAQTKPDRTEILRRIEAGLSPTAEKVEPTERGRWRASLTNGAVTWLDVRLVGDFWVVLEASPARRGRPPAPWRLLKRNHGFAPGAKLVRTGARRTRLRAELPVGDGEDLTRRVAEACEGCRDALKAVSTPGWAMDAAEAAPETPEAGDTDLAALCGAACWPCFPRSSGRVAAPLETRDGGRQALLAPRTGGGVDVTVETWTGPRPTKVCRRALAFLLLRVTGQVRLVRAFVQPRGEEVTVGLEAPLRAPARAPGLVAALSALSVAWELCGREAAAVTDESIAREYLARVERVAVPRRVDKRVVAHG